MLVIWLVLLGFIVVVASAAAYVLRHVATEDAESEAFLSALSRVEIDNAARREYEEERLRIFQKNQESKQWEDDRVEDDLNGDPTNAWHRELPEADRTVLRSALMKRTISVFPFMASLPPELQQKAHLYQRGLLGEAQWRNVMALRDWLQQESVEIRHEAECLAEKWGQDGTIFQEAAGFHQHLAKKRMQAAQEQALRQRAQPPHAPQPPPTAARS